MKQNELGCLTVPSKVLFFAVVLSLLGTVSATVAQDQGTQDQSADEMTTEAAPLLELPMPILADLNGDGQVKITAFGDSLTRGTGDFTAPNQDVQEVSRPQGDAGYPLRVENWLHVPVFNLGRPGEVFTTDGLPRFAQLVPHQGVDFVVVSGGSNDAFQMIFRSDYAQAAQTILNIARASGIQPIIATVPPVCCQHIGEQRFINEYNEVLRILGPVNGIPVADIDHAYQNTCNGNITSCALLNRPEGLHPNSAGYDVSAEAITATLLNINLFAPDGPALLAQALQVPVTSIRTVPDPTPPASEM